MLSLPPAIQAEERGMPPLARGTYACFSYDDQCPRMEIDEADVSYFYDQGHAEAHFLLKRNCH
eukprot:4271628-Pyramimonas_sp.AAC.1